MATLIFGHSDVLAAWAAKRIEHVGETGFGPCQAIGVASGPYSDDILLGVCVYHDYQPQAGTIQISFASISPRWATRDVISQLLAYPFEQLAVRKVWMAIPHPSQTEVPRSVTAMRRLGLRTLRFNVGIGLRIDGVLRHHFSRNRHAVIVSMMQSEYRKSAWCRQPQVKAAA
jgi:hypothetical protein